MPKWKEQEIKLGKVLNDLKNNIPINNIDEGLAECGDNLITALKTLSKENYSNLAPSPLVVKLEYSHPTLSQRITAIEKLKEENRQ